MKITNVEVFVLADPPPTSDDDVFNMPSAGAWGVRLAGTAFVRILTDEGVTGLSEVFSVPPAVVKAVLDGPDAYLARHLIGEDPFTPDRLWSRLYNTVLHSNRRGWQMICIGALDVALWDLFGKALDRPVWQLLGGIERPGHQIYAEAHGRREVVPYCTIVSRSWDRETVLREQIEKVERLRDLGYRAVKIEPMKSTPETIVDLTRLARAALGPHCILCVDVGALWNDVGMALSVIDRLAEYNVFFFETPFPADSVDAYARLTARTRVRIAAGEHTVTRWEFLDLMDRGGIQVVQPYVVTVGGLTEARHVVEFAVPRGVLVVPGGWTTQVQAAATIQFSAVSPVTPIFEYTPAEIYPSPLRSAIQELGHKVIGGVVSMPTEPGNGIELPEDLIDHFRIG